MMTRACLVVFLTAFVLSDDVGADLVALYEFEGDFTDSTGSFDATELGLPEFSDDTPPTGSEQALMLSGDSGLGCGNVAGDGDDLSIAFWLKEGMSNRTYSVCLSKQELDPWAGPHPVDPIGFSVLLRSSDDEGHSIIFRIGAWQTYGGWGSELRTTTDVYGTDRWAHFAFTYDDETDTATAYVDGEFNGSMSGIKERGVGGAADKTFDLSIGMTQEPFEGYMDDIALFDHVLTEEEVVNIYDGDFDAYFSPSEGTRFVRGDPSSNGTIDLTDGILILNYLFVGGPEPACGDSADADDDGVIALTDAVRIFGFLFGGGDAPAAPSPAGATLRAEDCGPDPTDDDALDCVDPGATCQ